MNLNNEKIKLTDNLKMKDKECEEFRMKVEILNAENIKVKKEMKCKDELVEQIGAEILKSNNEFKSVKDDWNLINLIKIELNCLMFFNVNYVITVFKALVN